MIKEAIKEFLQDFLEKTKDQQIYLVSHFDTDGITSAAILSKTLGRLNKRFSVKIIKQLTEKEIKSFPKDKIIFLLDLGASHLKELSKLENQVFIIDHHEIDSKTIPENVNIVNPHLIHEYENLCSAELSYLFSHAISKENKDLSHLAIIGMVGDTMEKEITKTRNYIIQNAQIKIKKGLLIYPSTRPLDKTLEYCSTPFIPKVTGNPQGAYELLQEANIAKVGKTFKSLIDLTETEMKNLITAVLLRIQPTDHGEYIGNLYLIKLFNKIEDAREISAMINACSRMDFPEVSLMFCMGNANARKKAAGIYVKYRQHIIAGLKFIDKDKKIIGEEYIIINAKDNIKDTLIGTMTSILSFSKTYKDGTIIIGMAYNDDKIKISARIAGRKNPKSKNLKKLMDATIAITGGISGGHKNAAGCVIDKQDEEKFISTIKKKLDLEIKI